MLGTGLISIAISILLASLSTQSSTVVIREVRVIDGTGKAAIQADVVVVGNRIRAITTDSQQWQSGNHTTIIDGRNKTLLPGLIDLHIHLVAGGDTPSDKEALTLFYRTKIPEILNQYLVAGVTSIQSTGDPLDETLRLRDQINRGEIRGPRLYVAGPVVTAVGGHPATTIFRNNPFGRSLVAAEVSNEDEAREQIRFLKRKGVDYVKFVYQGDGVRTQKLRPGIARVIIDEAHKLDLRVGVHSGGIEDTVFLLESGVDTLLHGISQQITDDNVIQLLANKKAYYVATLQVMNRPGAPILRTANTMANLGLVSKHAVKIAVGTDTFLPFFKPGVNTHREAALMVEAGMTPMAVIVAATRTAAEQLQKLSDFGTVEPGKVADLLIVEGNPDQDIQALGSVHTVIREGQIVVREGKLIP